MVGRGITVTNYEDDTTLTTTSTSYTSSDGYEGDITTGDVTYQIYTYEMHRCDDLVKEIGLYLSKLEVYEMKSKWSDIRLIKKYPLLRNNIRLRNVCLNGRGWC